jgi:hypothetical protein
MSMGRVPGSNTIIGLFAVSSERAVSAVYSAGAVVVFWHDGLLWFLVLDGSTSRDFASDLVSCMAEISSGVPRRYFF